MLAMTEGYLMRFLILVASLVLLSCSTDLVTPGVVDGSGGTWVIPDPGFCWGTGVVPGVPPDFCWGEGVLPGTPPDGYWSSDGSSGGPYVPLTYGAGGAETMSGGLRPGPVSNAAAQHGSASRAQRSQMYIPAAVWRWVAEHPARAR